MLNLLKKSNKNAAPAETGSEVVAPPVGVPPQTLQVSENSLEIVELIEKDILRAMAAMRERAGEGNQAAIATSAVLKDIHGDARELVQISASMADEIIAIAAASEELAQNSHEIAEAVGQADDKVRDMSGQLESTAVAIADLAQASREIGGILETISDIARKTNLLALNATIEAARVGEAGRGFAVVATEVKSLSVASDQAATAIRKRIEALQSSANGTIENVQAISNGIAEVRPLLGAVTSAVREQRAATDELAQRSATTTGGVQSYAESIRHIDELAASAAEQSSKAENSSSLSLTEAEALGRRFTTAIRQMEIGDRRQHARLPLDRGVMIDGESGQHRARSIDLGLGGMLLEKPSGAKISVGARLRIALQETGQISLRVVAVSTLGIHCAFENLTAQQQGAIAGMISDIEQAHLPLIERVQAVAAKTIAAMEGLLSSGQLTISALFDTDYQLIPGSNPPQFANRAVALLEQVLPPIFEPELLRDQRTVFCCALDRNGYLPVHNAKFSHPPRKDDVVWNTAHCRNKRIFDDRAGLSAARSRGPFLIQSYRRDMGGGQFVQMEEVDAPIVVAGRLWGGARLAVQS